MDPVGVQGGDGPARCGAEPDHHRAQPGPVVAGGPREAQGVKDRAVPGELVVLVEHVQTEVALPGPVVHRLEGDEGEPTVDRGLRQPGVLHTVRPAPQDATLRDLGHLSQLGFREQQHVGGVDHLGALRHPPHARLDKAGIELEVGGVAAFDDHACAEVRLDPVQVPGMYRESTLVLHGGAREQTEAEEFASRGDTIASGGGGGGGRVSGSGHPDSHHQGTESSSWSDYMRPDTGAARRRAGAARGIGPMTLRTRAETRP